MNSTTRPLTADTVVRLLLDTHPYLSCDDCFSQWIPTSNDSPSSRGTTSPGCEPIWKDAAPAPRRSSPC